MNRIYLDQASTSFPKAPGVAQAMMDYLTTQQKKLFMRHASCWQNFSTFPNAKM